MKIYNAGNRIMNTWVYRVPTGYVMIDTGYENSLKNVERKLNRLGITLSDIRYIFLTHAHDDHAGFLNELLAKCPNIKVIISPKAMPILLRGQHSFVGGCSNFMALVFCKFMVLIGKGEHLFPVIEEKYLDRFIKIDFKNIKNIENLLQGKILFTPGHTADSISLKRGNIIFCGDVAMNGVPSSKRITIWIEDKKTFYDSWNLMIREKVKFIYPAHGKPFRSSDLKKYRKYISQRRLYRLK